MNRDPALNEQLRQLLAQLTSLTADGSFALTGELLKLLSK
jgi:hypothetical protein